MMQGHFAALSSKYDNYCPLYCIDMTFISLKSQMKMLSHDINHIIVNQGLFLLGVREIEKQLFTIYFLSKISRLIIHLET